MRKPPTYLIRVKKEDTEGVGYGTPYVILSKRGRPFGFFLSIVAGVKCQLIGDNDHPVSEHKCFPWGALYADQQKSVLALRHPLPELPATMIPDVTPETAAERKATWKGQDGISYRQEEPIIEQITKLVKKIG